MDGDILAHECRYLLLGVGVRAQAEVYIVQAQSGRASGVLVVLEALGPHTLVMVFHTRDAHSLGIQDQVVPQVVDRQEGLQVTRDRSWDPDLGSLVGPIQEILNNLILKVLFEGCLRSGWDHQGCEYAGVGESPTGKFWTSSVQKT